MTLKNLLLCGLSVIVMMVMGVTTLPAQEVCDSVFVFFKQGSSSIDPHHANNDSSLILLNNRYLHYPPHTLKSIRVFSSASPEGSKQRNELLSLQRSDSVVAYMNRIFRIDSCKLEVVSKSVDWEELKNLVQQNPYVPYRTEVLELLLRDESHLQRLSQLQVLKGGEPYRWLYRHVFPNLRQALVILTAEEPSYKAVRQMPVWTPSIPAVPEYVARKAFPASGEEPCSHVSSIEKRKCYLALKTNALYDAALVPNVGVEVYLGKQWSVGGNWMYAWWSNRGKNNFWRIYGGDVEVRRWLGRKADEKPLQGHHVGLYGQMATYDFELGGRGYLGDKWAYGAGISYGYSLPVAKRLNMDFTLGLGYLSGEYKEYLPMDGHYVWQVTKHLHWWGPTKAEVSLVWLLGRGNNNVRKGGRP